MNAYERNASNTVDTQKLKLYFRISVAHFFGLAR